jgi:hypothetical protein
VEEGNPKRTPLPSENIKKEIKNDPTAPLTTQQTDQTGYFNQNTKDL